jgi:hypothetical protein
LGHRLKQIIVLPENDILLLCDYLLNWLKQINFIKKNIVDGFGIPQTTLSLRVSFRGQELKEFVANIRIVEGNTSIPYYAQATDQAEAGR